MRIEELPSPGTIPSAQKLRLEALKAINFLVVVSTNTAGKTDHAAALQAFFTACATEAGKYKPAP